MQNEMQWRERAEQIGELFVRSNSGERVRLSNLVTITPTVGAPFLQQYNQFPSVSVSGSAAGVSSSTAMAVMGEILARTCLPDTTMPGAACRIRSSRPAIRRSGSCWRRW
jgi:multidrug efflux pump subunit AcrB